MRLNPSLKTNSQERDPNYQLPNFTSQNSTDSVNIVNNGPKTVGNTPTHNMDNKSVSSQNSNNSN